MSCCFCGTNQVSSNPHRCKEMREFEKKFDEASTAGKVALIAPPVLLMVFCLIILFGGFFK